MRVNIVQESARHLQMTRARQMRVDTRDLPGAHSSHIAHNKRKYVLAVSIRLVYTHEQPS